jgi:hypothetical protein
VAHVIRRWRHGRLPVVGLFCLVMLGFSGSADASRSRTEKVPAHFVFVTNGIACEWGIGVAFSKVWGATGYLVSYYDGYYQKMISTALTPKQLASSPGAKGGELFLGVTGGGYSPPCTGDPDPTENGRFSRGAKVVATLGAPVKLSGRVVSQTCSKSGCARKPRSGVRVLAKTAGVGRGGSATTDKHGRYRIRLDKGIYNVSLAGVHGLPEKQRVGLTRDLGGVDFVTCAGAHNAQAAFPGLRCEADVSVKVVDLSGKGLPNVTILASNHPASNDVFELPSAAEATTDKNGVATFRLTDQKWTLELAASITAINPPGTDFGQPPNVYASRLEPDPNGGFNSSALCEGGTAGGGPDAGHKASCNFDIPHGQLANHFKSFRMSVTARVSPVNITLASGAGRSTVILDEFQQKREMIWRGVGAPRNRFHFELHQAGEWSVGAFDTTKAGNNTDPVISCSPGTVAPAPPNEYLAGIKSCQLDMPYSGGPAGSVGFGVAPG